MDKVVLATRTMKHEGTEWIIRGPKSTSDDRKKEIEELLDKCEKNARAYIILSAGEDIKFNELETSDS